MLSTCPSVRPSVVRHQIVYAILKKTNEPISMHIGTSGPRGKAMQRSTSMVRRSKFKVSGGRS